MRRCFRYRLYPAKAQERILVRWLEICRELHNAAIEERREAWKHGVIVFFFDQSRQLPALKRERPDVGEVNAQVLQQALRRVDLAFKHFFRRVKNGEKPGYPRFKGRDRYNSLTWPQEKDGGFSFVGSGKLRLCKLGDIRIKLHRPIAGTLKTCTVKREAGHWYAIFSCDDVPARAYPAATSEVGIDMGLASFATLSTGEKVANPRWYRQTEEKLKIAQRKLTSRQKKSRRRRKARERVTRLHAKIANQRRDFQHRLAKKIVSENALIAVEDLDPQRMVEKSSTGLTKSIMDASWGQFLSILACKAEEAGRRFARVPPHNTSSTCSRCGVVRKKDLDERVHSCPCGLVLDRDVNASLNILRLGRSLWVG